MTVVSVQSGASQSLVFTVTGTQTTAYAQAFATYAATANNFVTLGDANPAIHPNIDTVTLYEFNDIGGTATALGGYLLDYANGASTIDGSGAGDTVLFVGVNEAGTYVDNGGDNQVVFVSGDNLYDGTGAGATGNDTVVAGGGYDTIITGTGNDVIDSGTGDASITLNDTGTGTSFNDLVYLDDGASTVYADGSYDGVVANAAGQTLIGGTVVSAINVFVLNGAELAPTDLANDLVVAGAASITAVLDDTSGNTIFGGTGTLYAAVGDSVASASIVAGTGANYIFGADGSSITFYASSADTAANVLIGNAGSESLYGGTSDGNLIFFGGQAPDGTDASTYNETLTGGNGNDSFVSGSGFESLTGGAGNNTFDISAQDSSVGGANIVIADFGASAGNVYEFSGFTGNPVVSETEGSGGVTLTLSDNTTVTFVGETIAGLNGHLI